MHFNNHKFAKDLETMDHELMHSILESSNMISGNILLLSRSEGEVYTEAYMNDDNETLQEFAVIIEKRLSMVTEKFKTALN